MVELPEKCKICKTPFKPKSHNSICCSKQCSKQNNANLSALWKKQNKEHVKKIKQLWHKDNIEKVNNLRKAWKDSNRNKELANMRNYYLNNKEKEKQYQRVYYVTNKDKIQLYNKNNSDKLSAKCAKRRASKLSATPNWLTEEHFEQIKIFYKKAKNLGKWSNVSYHVDHIIPLQGKIVSGLHVPWNLRVITEEENLRKSNNLGEDYE